MSFALHHIGIAAGNIQTAALEYAARFGYSPCTPILHDPLQTAFVQFLRLPGDPAYLELVAPDGPNSILENAVQKGGGLNHICYASDHFQDAIAHLASQGMSLISAPKPAVAFAGRRICWLLGGDRTLVELVERLNPEDLCQPGVKQHAA